MRCKGAIYLDSHHTLIAMIDQGLVVNEVIGISTGLAPSLGCS